jgi:hypothetical protein
LQHDTTQPQLRRQQRRPWIVTNAKARLSFSTNNETRKMDMVHWKRRWMANMLFCLVKATATCFPPLWLEYVSKSWSVVLLVIPT